MRTGTASSQGDQLRSEYTVPLCTVLIITWAQGGHEERGGYVVQKSGKN